MGTIYPTGYPIGGNVQNIKLMEYGNYISNRNMGESRNVPSPYPKECIKLRE